VPTIENPMPLRSSVDVLEFLRCPHCRAALNEKGSGYVCSACQRNFPLERGVVRFVEPENYADSFGFQWQRYARTQLDHAESQESERDFYRKTGLTPGELKGKTVLDVGCGMGRFADVATRWGARVVGIDLSAAAEVAARNLAEREFVALQSDVFALPFAPESFDYIYSIGVLHHTPNCEQAVKTLPQYLKPGGTLAVWLYSAYNPWFRFSDLYRRFTHRMSAKTLHGILRVVVPVVNGVDSALRVLPVVGRPLSGFVRHVFPVNRNRNRKWRVLDTFDWYSPKYQSKHTYEQVFRWFEDCGLEDLHVVEVPISVRGKKPVARSHKL
jgi:SAM-dependent methyltransferase